jgi:acyl-CoA synthetase (AMP-forming)/AMP-acid ligase II
MAETLAQFFLDNFQAQRDRRAYRQRRGYRTESFTYAKVLTMARSFAADLNRRGIVK